MKNKHTDWKPNVSSRAFRTIRPINENDRQQAYLSSTQLIDKPEASPSDPDENHVEHTSTSNEFPATTHFFEIVELSPSLVLITDRWGYVEYANPTFLTSTGFGYDEVVGHGLDFLVSTDEATDTYDQVKNALLSGTSWNGVYLQRRKNGEPFSYSVKLSPVHDDDGFITNYVLVGENISPIIEAQQLLQDAVDEKGVLLSELHHRVKNNLAIMSSLMQLQAFNEENEEVKEQLQSNVGRVHSIASVHELLYESKTLNGVEMDRVIKRIIEQHVQQAEDDRELMVQFKSPSTKLGISQAQPLALLMNEIITSAFGSSYSSTDLLYVNVVDKEGHLHVRISATRQVLSFSEDLGDASSLSMSILKALMKQLNGTYSFSIKEELTTFEFSFKKKEEELNSPIRFSRTQSLVSGK
ncbi:MAG: histidine kinase dimerization/phosphoacceptor domain -containing protein [Bacteroidota bacterium]